MNQEGLIEVCERVVLLTSTFQTHVHEMGAGGGEAAVEAADMQRKSGEWMINTLMIEGCDAPFRYKRKKLYKDLKSQRVNLTYYPTSENIAGFEMEIMNVVRIKVS